VTITVTDPLAVACYVMWLSENSTRWAQGSLPGAAPADMLSNLSKCTDADVGFAALSRTGRQTILDWATKNSVTLTTDISDYATALSNASAAYQTAVEAAGTTYGSAVSAAEAAL